MYSVGENVSIINNCPEPLVGKVGIVVENLNDDFITIEFNETIRIKEKEFTNLKVNVSVNDIEPINIKSRYESKDIKKDMCVLINKGNKVIIGKVTKSLSKVVYVRDIVNEELHKLSYRSIKQILKSESIDKLSKKISERRKLKDELQKVKTKTVKIQSLGNKTFEFDVNKTNKYLDIQSEISERVLDVNKTPCDSKNYVGIELEFKTNDFNGLRELFKRDSVRKKITYKSDGSVHRSNYGDTTYDGVEICILDTQDEIYNTIEKVITIVKNNQAVVDHQCGLHVHIDMRNRDVEKSYTRLFNVQDILYNTQPFNRKFNTYCKRNKHKEFMKEQDVSSITPSEWRSCNTNRYRAINTLAYKTHSTLEIRTHEGILNYRHINNWIKFLIDTVDKGSVDKEYKTSNELDYTDSKVKTYLETREEIYNVV
jgi:hypothetical protein